MDTLTKAKKLLSKTFYLEDFLDNATSVSFKKGMVPFALIIFEEDEPNTLYYAVAVDAPDPFSIADIALRLINIAKVELSEPFYFGQNGEILWSNEAYEAMAKTELNEDVQNLYDLESPGKLVN